MKAILIAGVIVLIFIMAAPFWGTIFPEKEIYGKVVAKEYITEAPVTIVEFYDYECPYCKEFHPIMQEIRIEYGEKVKYIPKHYPLPTHEFAFDAAVSAECAKEQGKFKIYSDLLFETELKEDSFLLLAKEAGLSIAEFNDCIQSTEIVTRVRRDITEGVKHSVRGTPTLFVNGIKLEGVNSPEALKKTIDSMLRK